MLTNETIRKIEQFVYSKPRSIQEIAEHLQVSWRTTDRFVEEIKKNFGTLDLRVFREGTRGALKIVFWASVEKVSSNVFQEKLEEEILQARKKEEFSAFDIYQHIQDKNKKAEIEHISSENDTDLEEFENYLKSCQKQLLMFSGNFSFINLKNKKADIFKAIEFLVKKKIPIKIIGRVDISAKENVEKLLSLNFKYGHESIEIRHRDQPLRANIIDNKSFKIKEIKEPTGKIHELNKKLWILYTIKDKEWAEWLSRIFWKMFSSSVDARKRIEELKKLK